MNAMISVGSHRLEASIRIGPMASPFGAFRSTVERQIANSRTGNAQITSISRESNVSVAPPWKPARSARMVASRQQMKADPIPIMSELRPP